MNTMFFIFNCIYFLSVILMYVHDDGVDVLLLDAGNLGM